MGSYGKGSIVLVAACLFAAASSSAPTSVHGSLQMATEDRLQRPGWWPTKGAPPREEFLGPSACEPCHASKAQTQKLTPMANAATRPLASESLRSHEQLTFHVPPYTYQILRKENGSQYSVSDGAHSISLPVSWAFGLGESGQTYILEQNGTFFESRVSYYRARARPDFPPGARRAPSANLEDALGRRMLYAPETSRCFACHTTAS